LPRTRRVLIFSASFGAGHRSAASALNDHFERHYSEEVEPRVIDFFEEFAPRLNTIAKFAYEQSTMLFPDLYGTFFDLTNRMPQQQNARELVQVGYTAAEKYVSIFRPAAIVSVYPIAGGMAAEMKRSHDFFTATAVTDFGAHQQWVHPATDLYFGACDEVKEDLVTRGIPEDRVIVSGIPVHERFGVEVDRSQARKELGLEDRYTVLLTAAAGSSSEVKGLAKRISELGVQVVAVGGRHERLHKKLLAIAPETPGLRVYGFVEDMNVLMRACDLMVGKAGGLTVSEALAVGLPMVIFNAYPGQEMFNVDFIVNYGAGFAAHDEDDVVDKVRFLGRHPERLDQLAANARRLGRPEASKTVCDTVLAALR
jgi:processive 1,2-diacylglycerol beta-glucosyltransferase